MLTASALLFTLACLGVSVSVYLIDKRRAAAKPFCPVGKNCAVVLNSRYNRIFYFAHNDTAGLIFFLTTALLTSFLVIEVAPVFWWRRILVALVMAGDLMSLYLIYLQWQKIKAWCFWCVASAVIVFLMTLIIINT